MYISHLCHLAFMALFPSLSHHYVFISTTEYAYEAQLKNDIITHHKLSQTKWAQFFL